MAAALGPEVASAPSARLALYPEVPLFALDTLWLQVAGTICNLSCTHCFISCSPTNHSHAMMSLDEVKRYLVEAEALGVREYYLTGGEPFMNREILEIIAECLARGPVSILTNGLFFKRATVERLRAMELASEHSLDLRLSIDGWDAASNDPIRGAGTFDRILDGIRALAEGGLNPVITVTEAFEEGVTRDGRLRFLEFLRSIGLEKPRLKIMPLLRIGAEEKRLRGYAPWETLKGAELGPSELEALQCSSSRMVTSKGVYVCPLLIDAPHARMGATLAETMRPFSLSERACWTCHAEGLSCRT
ncbi:radical SAM protein [Myxococcota bacterium]|nr:radical SAM protein [Myxococcota bacterium]